MFLVRRTGRRVTARYSLGAPGAPQRQAIINVYPVYETEGVPVRFWLNVANKSIGVWYWEITTQTFASSPVLVRGYQRSWQAVQEVALEALNSGEVDREVDLLAAQRRRKKMAGVDW